MHYETFYSVQTSKHITCNEINTLALSSS